MTNKELCWDCPQRAGLSRITGNLAIFCINFKKDGSERISAQRGGCVGRVPVKVMTQFGVRNNVCDEVVTTTREGHTLYLAACSSGLEEIPEVPDDVRIGFGFNGGTHFVQPILEVTTTPREEYDSIHAKLRESFNQTLSNLSSE